MKQIHNLIGTIKEEELHIIKLKKRILHAESTLNAHREALTRLLAIPEQRGVLGGRKPQKGSQGGLERIMVDKWKCLGIELGDKVKIVEGENDVIRKGTHLVCDVEDSNYEGNGFLLLKEDSRGYPDWYFLVTKERAEMNFTLSEQKKGV